MPKDRRQHEKSGASPYKCSSNTSHQKLPLLKTPSENKENLKEWEEARCPVCMEHPHKAILLLCSSHDNNCRPYLCDTSSRHSNCYDQFLKSLESELACPLCRGPVMGSVVVEPAREFMNKKSRTCSREAHPRVRPSEADPRRQRVWEQLERTRGLGDVLSHLRSLEPSLPMITRDEGRRAMVTAGIFSMMQSIMPMSMTVEDLNGYCGYIYSDWNMRFV